MKKYPFVQVDAFTTKPLEGNPCAIIFDADDLDDAKMLSIAKEMNLSETVFVLKPTKSDFKARYFTPMEELPLAGHPTIALIHTLIELNKITPKENSDHCSVSLELKAGVIRVDINFKEDGHHEIVMYQKRPVFMNTYDADEVMPLFGLTKDDVLDGALIQTVSTGTAQLMIPVKNLDALKKSELNVAKYREFKARGDFSSPHLFCLSGVTSKGDTFARHFGLPPDTFEDPFTGSSTGNMACYLWKYNLIENPVFFAEQGHWMGRPGIAKVEVLGPRDDIETVKVIGNAVTSIKGELIL